MAVCLHAVVTDGVFRHEGVERIRARLVSDTTKWDTLSVKTRVLGLQLLSEGANYVKIGGTCRHHGPAAPTGCTTPDNNHWATTEMIQSITIIADSFAHYYDNYKIRINDIALPFGGGFDNGGNWEADIIDEYPNDGRCNDIGHCEHRNGKVADISRFVRPPSGPDIEMTDEQKERIRTILENTVTSVLEHGTPRHFHIRQE